jgi:hypothetical protein
MVAQLLGFNLWVLRILGDEVTSVYYDMGCQTDLGVANFYPYHYVRLESVSINSQVCFTSGVFCPTLGQFCNISAGVIVTVVSDSQGFEEKLDCAGWLWPNPLPLLEYSQEFAELEYFSLSSGDEVESVDDLLEDTRETHPGFDLPVLPPHPTHGIVFQYMQNFGNFVYTQPAQVLEAFVILHHTVLDIIHKADRESLHLPKYFLKLYYKCRHDTFSVLCLNLSGSNKIETDASLKRFIPSNRTPDFIHETKKAVYLYEFTVSNLYEVADFNKGGGIYDQKYDKEASQIQEKTGKLCKVVMVPAILNEYNLSEIVAIMSDFSTPIENLLSKFFSTANLSKARISSAYFSDFNSVKGVVPGEHVAPKLQKTLMLDAAFLSLMLKNWDWLMRYTMTLIAEKDDNHKIAFVYDKDTNKVTIKTEHVRGYKTLTLRECYDIMSRNSISDVLRHTNFQQSGVKLDLRSMVGDIAVTVPDDSKLDSKSVRWEYRPANNNIFSGGFPAVHDQYADFSVWDDSLLEFKGNFKVDFPPDYLDQLCSHSYKALLSTTSSALLANNEMNPQQISEAMGDFTRDYSISNNRGQASFKPKQTFLTPFATVPLGLCGFNDFSASLIETYIRQGKGPYTKAALFKAQMKSFFTEATRDGDIHSAREKFSDARRTFTAKLVSKGILKSFKKMTTVERQSVMKEHADMVNAQKAFSSLLGQAKRKAHNLIRLPCRPRSTMAQGFQKEMDHYKKENKGYKGVGMVDDFESLTNYFSSFAKNLLKSGFHSMKLAPLFNTERGPGPEFLTNDKNFYTDRWVTFYEESFKGTLLEQLVEVASRLSRVLFNESVKSYNSDFVKIDNLGFDNLIVLIRGGAKSYSNNRSKMFKTIFYINDNDLKYSGYMENTSFEIMHTELGVVVCTPWMQLNIDAVYDYFSLRQSTFLNLYSNAVRSGESLLPELGRLSVLPAILSLHNRRKTEQLMHNVRYLIVNPMAKWANLKGIIKTFSGFNYTYLDAWIRTCLKHRFESFSASMMGLSRSKGKNLDALLDQTQVRDLWFNEPFTNTEQLTSFIYITYMMTKAPVNSTLEQVSNLKEILADVTLYEDLHGDVAGMADDSLHCDVFKFDPKVYEDDFKYDPKFCQYLGFHLAGFLKNKVDVTQIENMWQNCQSKGLSFIANSNGLRGYKNENFFNKKGYEVVYDKIIDILEQGDKTLDELVGQYVSLDPESAYEIIQSDKVTFKDLTLDKITFHIVHKIQRGGSREIFCMDLVTKAYQNPIEMFMKRLCKLIPNEFISIQSGKRHSIIHTDFFERKPVPWVKETIRWVLDCRRWAPHSVFQKYMHFIHGLSPILPDGFVQHFKNLGDKMMTKEFCTREHVMNGIKGNTGFKDYLHLLKPDKEIGGKYNIKVPFSFVMGIFNYLSTIMHAANQILASEVVMQVNLRSGRGLVIMDAKCHSDDSVITSYHEKKESVRPTLLIYDWLAKNANHMLSVKKSQVNENVYLEFLSTLYLFDRFVPVISKFNSSIPFKPTDTGYSADVTFAISQCVEMMSQGGTIEEGFLILKLTERFIQDVYNINANYSLPHNFLGGLDIHPIECLLSGSNAGICSHLRYNRDAFLNYLDILVRNGFVSKDDPTALSVKWDMRSKMSPVLARKYDKFSDTVVNLSRKFPWTLEKCKLGNEYLNLVWYLNKLSDPKYYASMVSEPDSRRFTKAFGSGGYRNVIKQDGALFPVSQLTNLLLAYVPDTPVEGVGDVEKILNFLNDDLLAFYDSIEQAVWDDESVPNGLKDKPVHLNFSLPELGGVRITADQFVSYKTEPEAFKLIGLRSNPVKEVSKIEEYIRILGVDTTKMTQQQLYAISNKILNSGGINFRVIAPVPSQIKRVDDYTSLVMYVCHNSVRGRIRSVVSSSTGMVDWARKIVKGKVPKSVLEAVEVSVVRSLAEAHGVMDKDIFVQGLAALEQDKLALVPPSWRPLAYCAFSKHDKPLVEEVYWAYWAKEQVKVGRVWYGQGIVTLSIPEMMLEISVENGLVKHLATDSDEHSMFSTTSNWYLTNFFSQVGSRIGLYEASFGSPDCVYFGYNDFSGAYGVGLSNRFTSIFPEPILHKEVKKQFMFSGEVFDSRGRYHTYKLNNFKYKVEFFTPSVKSVDIDVGKYLDREKLAEMILDDAVSEFCFKMSVELRSAYSFEPQEVIDTIGFSKLYKVLYSNPDSIDLLRGGTDEFTFYESLMKWKKLDPDFGFPDESELRRLAKEADIPQLPLQALKILNRLGASTISDLDLQDIIINLCRTPPEKRLNYLLSVSPLLNEDERVTMLTISQRSKRIYSSCGFLGKDTFKVLLPVVELIIGAVEDNAATSDILLNIKMNYAPEKPCSYILSLIFCRILLTGITSHSICVGNDMTVSLFMSILDQLWDDGVSDYLKVNSTSSNLMRTVDFDVDYTTFSTFVLDLFDSLYLSYWMGQVNPTRMMISSDKFPSELNHYRKKILLLTQSDVPKTLEVQGKTAAKKHFHKLMKLSTDRIPGVVLEPFVPLGEVDLEELQDGIDFGDEVEEFLEKEELGVAKPMAYVSLTGLNSGSLRSVRGTAHHLLISTHNISRDALRCHGNFKFFRKTKNEGLVDFVSNYGNFIISLASGKRPITISGYTAYELQDYYKLENKLKSSEVVLDDVSYSKEQVWANPSLIAKLPSLDQYFKRMTVDSAVKEKVRLESMEEQAVDMNIKVRDDYAEYKKKFDDMISKFKEKPAADTPVEEANLMSSINDIVAKFDREGISMLDLTQTKKSLHINRTFEFTTPLNLTTDLQFIGEFNALFAGNWLPYERGELAMTLVRKRATAERAFYTIQRMPNEMQQKYVKVYLIMLAVMASIPTCTSVSAESHEFCHRLDELFTIDLDITADFNMLAALTPSAGEYRKTPNLDKIFGKKK